MSNYRHRFKLHSYHRLTNTNTKWINVVNKMVPVLFSYGLQTEKLANKYGSSIKDIDFYSKGAWYEFRPGHRLLRISTGVPIVPNFGRGTDCLEFWLGYWLFRISGGVPTVPNFGRVLTSEFRAGYRLFRILAIVATVPNFGQGTNCPGFRRG